MAASSLPACAARESMLHGWWNPKKRGFFMERAGTPIWGHPSYNCTTVQLYAVVSVAPTMHLQ